MDKKTISVKIKLSLSNTDLKSFKPETTKINIKNAELIYLKNEKSDSNIFVYQLNNIKPGNHYKNIFVTGEGLTKKIIVNDIFIPEDSESHKLSPNLPKYFSQISQKIKDNQAKLLLKKEKKAEKERLKKISEEESVRKGLKKSAKNYDTSFLERILKLNFKKTYKNIFYKGIASRNKEFWNIN